MTFKKHLFRLLFLSMAIMFQIACSTSQSIDCDEIMISPIGEQKVLAGTRSYLPLSVLANQLNNIKFKLSSKQKFVSLNETQRGRAILSIDPSIEDVGEHTITLDVQNGNQQACTSFLIQVEKISDSTRIINCDPRKSQTGDGSIERPYGSLKQLLDSGFTPKANDLILLHDGNHGDISLTGSAYSIASKKGAVARMTELVVTDASDLIFKGLEIRPENDTGDHDKYLIFVDSTSQGITLQNNVIHSIEDSSPWTIDDWDKKASRGIKIQARQSKVQHNLVQNIFHGIKTGANNIEVSYNHVDRFGGDAIRNIGSNNSYRFNFLTNATVDDYYDDDGNHDDLFQSWTFSNPVDKIILSNNTMISCIDTLMPQRAKIVQGLVCFDGFETNWEVANNLIVTDHPHGIALYGAENCEVYGNVVLQNPHKLYQFESAPWIMINNHKDGRESKNNIVRDNTCSALNIVSKNVETFNNTVLDSSTNQKLSNYDQWDFRIKE